MNINLLKTTAIIALSLYALNVSAASSLELANFGRYESDNKRVMELPASESRVVFMGNSITDFWPTNRPEFFALNDFIGRGISGQTTYEMILRFREDVVRLKPAGVVILAGTNDIAENLDITYNEERTLGNILSMAEIADANGIQVFLSSVLPVTNYGWKPSITNHKDKIENLNARIKEYADSHDMPYIDYYSAMVYGDRDLNYALTGDGVHPNAEGYRIMEGIVLPIIRERIKYEGCTIPEQVTLSGTAVAEENPVACTKVSVSAFEGFVELKKGGTLEIKNEDGTPFFITDNKIAENGEPLQVAADGVYCVSLDFLSKEASVKEVTEMCVLNCFNKKSMADLTYTGEGRWSGNWNVNLQMPWGEENRYRLMMTIGGEKVDWGYTLGADKEPDGSEEYFHMMRVVPANTWANTWRIPTSYDGKTVHITAVMRGTYTHSYTEASSTIQTLAESTGIVRQEGGITIALTDAVIYNLNGAQVAAVSKGESLTLPEGIYMVKAGELAEKIIIRK